MTTADVELGTPVRVRRWSLPAARTVGRDGARRLALAGLALVALYGLGAMLTFWFIDNPELGVAFFPAAGVTVSVLVLTPQRTWPLWLVLIAATELIIDVAHGLALPAAVGFALANTLEPLVAATGLRASRALASAPARDRLVVFAAWCVVVGPMVGAAIGGTSSVLWAGGSDWLATAGRWWLGDALGVLVVATLILCRAVPIPFDGRVGRLETTAMVALMATCIVVPAIVWRRPLIFAILPILIWAAMRGGSRAVSATGAALAFTAGWAAVSGHADQLIVAVDPNNRMVVAQLLIAVSLLAGYALVAEIADRRRVEFAMYQSEAQRRRSERAAMELAEAERRRIARETHDIVGNALNVMLLHAGAARRVLPEGESDARGFIQSIEDVGRRAFSDLDVALALASGKPDAKRGRGLGSLPELVGVMRKAGLCIDLDVQGDRGDVTTLVDWSAYRIVEEALTNVAKHAPAASAAITVDYQPEAIALSVVDDGRGARSATDPRPGRGLVGMRERVAALSGTLDARREGAGFAVRATLPRRGSGT
jgi:signal transduction histidine kinase